MNEQAIDNLQRLISLVSGKNLQSMVVGIGIVQNIDEDNRSCEIQINEDLTLFNCRLNAILDDYTNRLLIVPKDKSAVAFMAVDGKMTDPIVIAYSEIDKVLLKIGDTELNIDKDKVEINGGDNGGLINIEDLVSHINSIEDDINNLKTTITGWTPVAQDGGAALKGAISSWAGQSITKTKKSDLEDDKITH